MLQFLYSLFPSAKGPDPALPPRAAFETLFAEAPAAPLSNHFTWFEWVRLAPEETDKRLADYVRDHHSDFRLLPPLQKFYSVAGNPSGGSFLPVNESILGLLDKTPHHSRLVGLSLKEAERFEQTLRNMSEIQSHSLQGGLV